MVSTTTTTTFSTPVAVDDPHSQGDKLTAVNLQILRNLWLPDVEILNLKAFETHTVLSRLEGLWIGIIVIGRDETARGHE